MHNVKLIEKRNISGAQKGQAAAKGPKLVQMGSASKKTQGIGRGIEFLVFPRGA